MTRREVLSLIILVLVIAYGAYKYITREFSDTHSRYLLDTIVEISGSSNSKSVTQHILAMFNYVAEFEKKFDEYDPNSMIAQMNSSSEEVFPMDPDLYEMLIIADSLYRLTDGAFDITIKPVWDLWNFNAEQPSVPDSTLIKETLQMVGFDKLHYTKDKLIKPSGMQITLGAIAKGYVFDKVSQRMQEHGLKRGFINSRSSICFFGEKMQPIVYITHPRKVDDTIASFRLHNMCVGTSGDYQQYFEVDDHRYHHIINAHTGYPVDDVFSVTVLHPSAAWADGLSTALFLMPPEIALEYAKDHDQANCVIYYRHDDSIVSLKSAGMKELDFTENI